MICKKCGAKIERGDRRADGCRVCPSCGAVYRPKSKSGKRSAPRRGRAPRELLSLGAVAVVLLLLLIGLSLALGGREDRRSATVAANTAPASAAPTAIPTPTVEPTQAPTPTPSPEPSPSPTPTPQSIHFRAVGDVMSHGDQLELARQKDGSYDYSAQFQYVREALAKADYTIANLELSISPDGRSSGYPSFRIPEAILDTLLDCGIDLFTTANNHTLDGGFDGIVKTIDELDARSFAHLGTYKSPEAAQQPLVVDINGIRVGFLAYTSSVNGNERSLTSEQRKFCVRSLASADFRSDVQALRDEGAELVVCLPHWGEEGWRMVSNECKRYAQEMIDAGVDVILGSHPHMVQPIELREAEVDGEKKTVLIAWSLGNFISNMTYPYEDCGIILDFTVTREEGGLRIHDVGYVPIYVWNSNKLIAALCIGDFYDSPPEGMGKNSQKRMKESLKELDDVIGRDVALLEN